MNVTYNKRRTFFPVYRGNRELPQSEQIEVSYEAVSAAKKEAIMPRSKFRYKTDPSGKVEGGEAEITLDNRALITGMRPTIKNFSYSDGSGDSVHIKNGEDLFSAPAEVADDMIDELSDHFRKELRREHNEKN